MNVIRKSRRGGGCTASLDRLYEVFFQQRISDKGFFDDAKHLVSRLVNSLHFDMNEILNLADNAANVLSPSRREFFNHQARTLANSCDMRGASHALFPLPQGEGQGEGSTDKYHMNLTKRKLDGAKYGERVRSTIASLKVTRSVEETQSQTAENGSVFSCLFVRVKRRYATRLRVCLQPRLTIRFLSSVSFLDASLYWRTFFVRIFYCLPRRHFLRLGFAYTSERRQRKEIDLKPAFTLAEVLLTLGIIGIVSAMVIPTVIIKNNQKALQTAKTVANLKFEEALNQMRANDKLTGYDTADKFANEFTKYMKTLQRCTSDNLTNCFPMTIKTADEEIDPATLKTGAQIAPFAKKANYPSNNVGLTLPSGIMAIMNYDKTCEWKTPLTGGGTNRKEAMTCISMIYDVNGRKKPNKVGEDIILLNAQLFSCDGVKDVAGMQCIETSDTPYTPLDCTSANSSSPDYKYCGNYPSGYSSDMWAGAKKACYDKGMRLPNLTELANMAKLTYGLTFAPGREDSPSLLTVVDGSLNIINSSSPYWSSEEYNKNYAHTRYFNTTYTNWIIRYKSHSENVARCVR